MGGRHAALHAMIAALDTAGPWVCAALGTAHGIGAQVRKEARLNHNEIVASAYTELLASGPDRPTALAVNVGPGTFTGTRVGVSFVAGLGQALGLSVLPVSAFTVAATLAPDSAARIRVALPLVRDVWGVGLLSRRLGAWHEEACEEMSEEQLNRLDDFDLLLAPWGAPARATTAPHDWNPAVALLQLAALAPDSAYQAPHMLTVRYLGKCQAERVFEARHAS